MNKTKLSGPAVFMYSAILLTFLLSAVCFIIYYCVASNSDLVLWVGIVSFMILYHFGLRIFMGEVTKRLKINYMHPWFKRRSFEKKLYRLLRVRSWKDRVLTFEPENYDFEKRTLDELATTMAKSELDHWINEVISLTSILFLFLWGCPSAFIITAALAMLFDGQFIIVQRYNRPIVLRLKEARMRTASRTAVKDK